MYINLHSTIFHLQNPIMQTREMPTKILIFIHLTGNILGKIFSGKHFLGAMVPWYDTFSTLDRLLHVFIRSRKRTSGEMTTFSVVATVVVFLSGQERRPKWSCCSKAINMLSTVFNLIRVHRVSFSFEKVFILIYSTQLCHLKGIWLENWRCYFFSLFFR